MPDGGHEVREAMRPIRNARGLTLRVLLAIGATTVVALSSQRLAEQMLAGDLPLVVAGGISMIVGGVLVGELMASMARAQMALADRYEATHDPLTDQLTGLGNHRAFQEALDQQVAEAERYGTPVSLVLIDLDEFKAVNDRHGHAAGDAVLMQFGRMLTAAIRRADRAFRVGGDEFALLLPHTDSVGAHIVARRLLASALEPQLRDTDASVRVRSDAAIPFSAGISSLPLLADGRARLYFQAEGALRAVKHNGRTEVAIFDPTAESMVASSAASAALADVISSGQLRPVYQPIVELATGRVLGVEGLIRAASESGFSNPASLFEAAEASGRLTALDLACIDTIIAGASRLPADQFLSVNLSPHTAESPDFSPDAVFAILFRRRFAPERLVVELTEHQPIQHPERVRRRLDTLRAAGIRIAADDLGAGNAGLRLLAEIRFEVLKVDLSLIRRSDPGSPSTAVIRTVVEHAERTGAVVIAEGVERLGEVAQLMALGVRAAQGFHLGHPGPLVSDPLPDSERGPELAAWRQSIGLTGSARH